MPRENLKLLSIRIDAETYRKIEEFAKKHTYWKRNSIINLLLTTVFQDFNEKQVYDMLRRQWYSKNEIKAEYELTNLLKEDKQ